MSKKKQGRAPTIRKLRGRAGTANQLLKSEAQTIKDLLKVVETLEAERDDLRQWKACVIQLNNDHKIVLPWALLPLGEEQDV